VRMAPGDLPAARPVVVGVQARSQLGDDPDAPSLPVSGVPMAVEPVLSAESLPLVGPAGLLIDYRMLVTDRIVYDQVFTVYVAAAADAPAPLRAALADRGFSVATTLAGERETLDQSAYALALRLYAVAAALVLVMAFAGLFVSTAVQLPARRRDAAALRVVGVPRRVVVSAVARELVVVLGGAAVAGIGAGALAQYLVLRTIRLGYVEDLVTPRLVPSVDVGRLAMFAAAAALALGAFALLSGALTVRGARGATLRENAR
jgi:putative ABC transport system permease protein